MHANSAGGELGSDAEDTVELLERLKLSNQPKNPRIGLISHRFFGQSSNPYMVKLALEIKNQMYGMPNQPVASVLKVMAGRRPQYWNYPSVSQFALSQRSTHEGAVGRCDIPQRFQQVPGDHLRLS
jgi:hypothetical protein